MFQIVKKVFSLLVYRIEGDGARYRQRRHDRGSDFLQRPEWVHGRNHATEQQDFRDRGRFAQLPANPLLDTCCCRR